MEVFSGKNSVIVFTWSKYITINLTLDSDRHGQKTGRVGQP